MTKRELENLVETLQKSEDKLNYFVSELDRIEYGMYKMYKKRQECGSSEVKTARDYWVAIYSLKNHLLNDESYPLFDDIEE